MFVWRNGKKCFLFQKEAEACENDFDRWIYVLKNMETFNRLPWMAKDSVFHRLSEIADVSAMTKEERQKYDYAIRKYRDNLCVYEGALQTGRAQGRAQGRTEVALKMKAKGFPLEDIMDCTGLSADEINALS